MTINHNFSIPGVYRKRIDGQEASKNKILSLIELYK